jgi:hypothetical protein
MTKKFYFYKFFNKKFFIKNTYFSKIKNNKKRLLELKIQ